MSGIVDDILSITDDILGLRDDLGAIKHLVYILTRTWSGVERGDGTPTDVKVQILPTPYIVDLNHDLRLREGGKIKEGDLIIKMISKQSYPLETSIDCSISDKKVEKFYLINNLLYQVVHVKSHYVYWDIHIRKNTNQKLYLA